ncbi:hypothetical protein ONS95_011632 [Cadophora gregata]|uniref:uncharacterized protein n=1 Tax=Cadophora gregata TaxID=51156 RepID=UPI0026DDBE8C|nr:uncharacterized protein ONS95_011632 [Cadophora gregata]KAK0120226.1 hypothetical protein ONS95_011632 [Cadophora gregata]KAK0121261.1 hypothetical protein ONS96_011436 [Cadophora gregata f. sp. sojae]
MLFLKFMFLLLMVIPPVVLPTILLASSRTATLSAAAKCGRFFAGFGGGLIVTALVGCAYWFLDYHSPKEMVDYDIGVSELYDPARLLFFYEAQLRHWKTNPSLAIDEIISEDKHLMSLDEIYDDEIDALERYVVLKKKIMNKSKNAKSLEDATMTWLEGRAEFSMELIWKTLECRLRILRLIEDLIQCPESRNQFLLTRELCLEYLRVKKALGEFRSEGWAAYIGKQFGCENENGSVFYNCLQDIPGAMSPAEELERCLPKASRRELRKFRER